MATAEAVMPTPAGDTSGPAPAAPDASPASPRPAADAVADADRRPGVSGRDAAAAAQEQDRLEESSFWECNICLEIAKEPVVTLCGHLYCWPCLYKWMQVQSYCKACPVCKAGVEVDKVVPIYGRGSDAAQHEALKEKPLPPRPAGTRLAVVQQPPPAPGATQQGVLPALFGFQLGPGQGYVEAITPEQQHQAFLSRLLLMLGSFVIMCLLLF